MQTQRSRLTIATAVDNSRVLAGLTLTYARWVLIGGMALFFAAIALFLRPKGSTYDSASFTTALAMLGLYGVVNLVVWLLLYVSKGKFTKIGRTSLFVDIIATAGACYFASLAFKLPLFAFTFLPAVGLFLLVGLSEAALALMAGAVVTLLFLIASAPAQPLPTLGQSGLDMLTSSQAVVAYSIILTGFLALAALYLINLTPDALIRSTDTLIDSVIAEYDAAVATEQNRRIDALFRIAKTLSETLNYGQLSASILSELETVFDITIGALLTFETDATMDTLVIDNAIRLSESEMQTRIRLDSPSLRQAALKVEPQLITNVAAEEELIRALPSLRSSAVIMIAPLRGGYESYGVLLIASRKAGAYDERDLILFNAMASHIGIAMQNAQLYHNLFEDRNKILTAEEEVRRELNRNLHDGPAQAVAAFAMQSEYIRRLFSTEPEKALEELSLLGKQAQQTSKEIRNLLFTLRPLVLETQGLVGALEQFATSLNQTPGNTTRIHCSSVGLTRRFNPKVETAIFTILQEAVNNARKHAQARNIWIRIELANNMLFAIAQDDGVGFDLNMVQNGYGSGKSYGLGNMNERASLIGGSIKIESAPGQGTRMMLYIPITAKMFQGAADDEPETPQIFLPPNIPLPASLRVTDSPRPQPTPVASSSRRHFFGSANGKGNAGAVLGTGELPPPPSPR